MGRSPTQRERRLRRIGALLGLAAALLSLPLLRSQLFRGFEQRTVDARLRLRGTAEAAPEIVVCAIDGASIDALGQWPWPRSTVARLVDRLHDAGARVIAFDIVFSEPDRGGPGEDAALAAALERAGTAVLGFFFDAEPRESAATSEAVLPLPVEMAVLPPAGLPELLEFRGIEPSLPLFTRAAPAGGHFVIQPDDDGTVRHYPLIVLHEGTIYPALALRSVQVFLGSPPITVRPYQGRLPLIELGALAVPASERGELWVNFRGPYGQTFPYVSAAEVIAGRAPPSLFAGRLVFIGATETGIGDLRTSPFDVTMPGVEVHATVADNLLHRRFLRDGAPETIAALLAILLLGPLCGLLAASFTRPVRAAAAALLALVAYAVAAHLALVLAARHAYVFVPLLSGALGFAAAAVWRNVFAEARARQIRSTFTRYVSAAVVEEMLHDPDKVRLGGEKRDLTVLFSDIRGFTSLAERLEPDEVVTMLNAYLTPMTRIILDHGGTLDKYMGDAIMAFFGAPVAMADHAERACAAALVMRRTMADLAGLWSQRGLPLLASGIGLNSGPMAVGNMGSEMIFDYTVIGDQVNLGSRLEGLTRLYGVDIVVSDQTAERVRERFCLRELDRVQVKGKQQPVRVYELYCSMAEAAPHAELLATFAAALDAYRARRFDEAEQLWRQVAALDPDDGPTALYLKRLAALASAPPAPEWDAVTRMLDK